MVKVRAPVIRATARSVIPPITKIRATFHLPRALFEEARDAVVHLSGPPVRLTLAALAERALTRELDRLRRTHNDGKSFPRRQGQLRSGRPISR